MIPKDIFGSLPTHVEDDIIVTNVRHHNKATEAYVDVDFALLGETWSVSVPVNYRRTGLDAQTKADCIKILKDSFQSFLPKMLKQWRKETQDFWDGCKKKVTRPFFDALYNKLGKWVCQNCEFPTNPNWARRTQDIKEFGFTLATRPGNYLCPKCQKTCSALMLLPIKRGAQTGYEIIDSKLKKRIIEILGSYDAYEGKKVPPAALLADHKFSEIRWDEKTRAQDLSGLSDDEIRDKFQLITNQRNQQKREVCRACLQSGIRGYPYGIEFFWKGTTKWPETIPKKGKAAIAGCEGCGWYDLERWRKTLNDTVKR